MPEPIPVKYLCKVIEELTEESEPEGEFPENFGAPSCDLTGKAEVYFRIETESDFTDIGSSLVDLINEIKFLMEKGKVIFCGFPYPIRENPISQGMSESSTSEQRYPLLERDMAYIEQHVNTGLPKNKRLKIRRLKMPKQPSRS